MLLQRIHEMLESCATASPVIPCERLYNERWLLCLVLDWFAQHAQDDASQSGQGIAEHPLAFMPGARWFSGAHLASPFAKRYKGDRLAARRFQADGLIGHFDVRLKKSKPVIDIQPDAQQFVVIITLLFKPLKPGGKHTRYFDEVANALSCQIETLHRANRYPVDMAQVELVVIAPQAQIDAENIAAALAPATLAHKNQRRVREYHAPQKQEWLNEWLLPALDHMRISTISWESLWDTIYAHDPAANREIREFFLHCVALS